MYTFIWCDKIALGINNTLYWINSLRCNHKKSTKHLFIFKLQFPWHQKMRSRKFAARLQRRKSIAIMFKFLLSQYSVCVCAHISIYCYFVDGTDIIGILHFDAELFMHPFCCICHSQVLFIVYLDFVGAAMPVPQILCIMISWSGICVCAAPLSCDLPKYLAMHRVNACLNWFKCFMESVHI